MGCIISMYSRSLVKGFLFKFFEKAHYHEVITCLPLVCNDTLLVFSQWEEVFPMNQRDQISCSVLVEFLHLPMQFSPFLEHILCQLDNLFVMNLYFFSNPRLPKPFFLHVNPSKELKEFVFIRVGDNMLKQPSRYIIFPNACFCYRSLDQKIHHCSLMAQSYPQVDHITSLIKLETIFMPLMTLAIDECKQFVEVIRIIGEILI